MHSKNIFGFCCLFVSRAAEPWTAMTGATYYEIVPLQHGNIGFLRLSNEKVGIVSVNSVGTYMPLAAS